MLIYPMKNISLLIIFIFLFFTNITANEKIDDLKSIITELPNQIKNKNEYQKEENLLIKLDIEKKVLKKRKDNSISFNTNINKEKREIDSVKLNMGTKF